MAEHLEQRLPEPDDPDDGGEQRKAGDQRQRKPYLSRPILALRRQPAGEDCNEHQVVDAEDDLERRQRQETRPNLRIAKPIHVQLSAAGSMDGVGYRLRGRLIQPRRGAEWLSKPLRITAP